MSKWCERQITDSAQRILQQIPSRAIDRGLGLRGADGESIVMFALWSVLLWERKIGLDALEHAGADRFALVRDLDRLLEEKTSKLPVAYENPQTVTVDNKQHHVVTPKTDQLYEG